MTEKQTNQMNFTVQKCNTHDINQAGASAMYSIFLLEGSGKVSVDVVDYIFEGKIALFTTPYQVIHFDTEQPLETRRLQFHGDFYCIEYHKKEVSCNGLLFNNIYQQPYINLEKGDDMEMDYIFEKLVVELKNTGSYAEAVVKAYLQLMLALCSKVKSNDVIIDEEKHTYHPLMKFKALLENNFHTERQPSFYAAQMSISPNKGSVISSI
jgi:AraC family transcriptional activator of pobA